MYKVFGEDLTLRLATLYVTLSFGFSFSTSFNKSIYFY